jgi:hypothetical protein
MNPMPNSTRAAGPTSVEYGNATSRTSLDATQPRIPRFRLHRASSRDCSYYADGYRTRSWASTTGKRSDLATKLHANRDLKRIGK